MKRIAKVSIFLSFILVLPIFLKKREKVDIYFARGGFFIRGGKCVDGEFLPYPWKSGKFYFFQEFGRLIRAPKRPSPVLVTRIELEKTFSFSQDFGTPPDTSLKFSPDGRYLAIGTFFGKLILVDLKTKKIIFKKKFSFGMVKKLCWSLDSKILYIGEQSPDGFVYAFSLKTKKILWRFRLAKDLGRSILRKYDIYSFYRLCGCYNMRVKSDGNLIVLGTHTWKENGKFIYRSRIYLLSKDDGKVIWSWPKSFCLPYSIVWFDTSKDGKVIAFLTYSWGRPKKNFPYKRDTLYVLCGDSGDIIATYKIPPLYPYYDRIFAWHSVGVSDDGRYISLGLGDGRVYLFKLIGKNLKLVWEKDLGTPIVMGKVPISSPITYVKFGKDEVFFLLPTTTIPPSYTGSSSLTYTHPSAHTLFCFDLLGNLKWRFKFFGSPQGLSFSSDKRWLVVGICEERNIEETDYFGAILFDCFKEGGGFKKFVYFYQTEGPPFYITDISKDGSLFALAEVPMRVFRENRVYGSYRVHVVH